MIDFVFDGESLSEHGFIIGFFDSEMNWSGGSVNFNVSKTPGSDKQHYYSSSFEEPLVATISICKNPCHDRNGLVITQEEQANIMRWLVRTDGYHWLQFNTEEYEDVWYNCYINATPHIIKGDLVGFDLTITTDSPYGYSKLFKKQWDTSEPEFSFKNYSNKPGIIYPRCTITPSSIGKISFSSGNDDSMVHTVLNNTKGLDKIILDGDIDEFTNISPNDFNFVFPVIRNTYYDNVTKFIKNSDSVDFTMDLEWRYIKWVVAV